MANTLLLPGENQEAFAGRRSLLFDIGKTQPNIYDEIPPIGSCPKWRSFLKDARWTALE
jgi:hypothetical protein